MTLNEHCRRAALSFLQSALIVDDRAYEPEYTVGSGTIEGQAQSEAETPTDVQNLKKETTGELIRPTQYEIVPEETNDDVPVVHIDERGLDARSVTDAFARLGICCSVLQPKIEDEEITAATPLASRTDIVILDWSMYEDDGSRTLAFITAILKKRLEDSSALPVRQFVIYTVNPNTALILDKIEGVVGSVLGNEHCFREEDMLRIEGFQFKIFKKTDVEEKDLPERIIDVFTKLHSGLLQTAALGALGAVRKATQKILGRFDPKLDAPYLIHRALLGTPEEAPEQLIPLIASEIEGVLEEMPRDYLPTDAAIEAWLRERQSTTDLVKNLKSLLSAQAHKAGINDSNVLAATLKIVLKGPKEAKKDPLLTGLKDAYRSVSKTAELSGLLLSKDALTLNSEFALLMSTKTRYTLEPPVLTLGTIVKDNSSDQLLLCVQPSCDSVRVFSNRRFPFLPLRKNELEFSVIVRDGDDLQRLAVRNQTYEVEYYEFAPLENVVRSSKEGSKWVFQDTAVPSRKFTWMAELKPDQAQRVTQRFSQQYSRVGLNESEWLQICSG